MAIKKFYHRMDCTGLRRQELAAMMAYMISHDAHHRGQVCMLAHQLGFPLPAKATSEMWAWEKLWKECGFTHPR
jgi:uncharacterized damage-inducible protein DinB